MHQKIYSEKKIIQENLTINCQFSKQSKFRIESKFIKYKK